MMKIVTWNINGYRSITGQNPSRRYDKVTKENRLFEYIEKEKPDIICLQEIKADLEQINEELRQPEGYTGFYNPCRIKKGYSGVAVLSRQPPLRITCGLGESEHDREGRVLTCEYPDFNLVNV